MSAPKDTDYAARDGACLRILRTMVLTSSPSMKEIENCVLYYKSLQPCASTTYPKDYRSGGHHFLDFVKKEVETIVDDVEVGLNLKNNYAPQGTYPIDKVLFTLKDDSISDGVKLKTIRRLLL